MFFNSQDLEKYSVTKANFRLLVISFELSALNVKLILPVFTESQVSSCYLCCKLFRKDKNPLELCLMSNEVLCVI